MTDLANAVARLREAKPTRVITSDGVYEEVTVTVTDRDAVLAGLAEAQRNTTPAPDWVSEQLRDPEMQQEVLRQAGQNEQRAEAAEFARDSLQAQMQRVAEALGWRGAVAERMDIVQFAAVIRQNADTERRVGREWWAKCGAAEQARDALQARVERLETALKTAQEQVCSAWAHADAPGCGDPEWAEVVTYLEDARETIRAALAGEEKTR